jgi:hypothetical protein
MSLAGVAPEGSCLAWPFQAPPRGSRCPRQHFEQATCQWPSPEIRNIHRPRRPDLADHFAIFRGFRGVVYRRRGLRAPVPLVASCATQTVGAVVSSEDTVH